MTKDKFYQRYKRWATRCHWAAMDCDIDNAVQLTSYSVNQTAGTVSDVAVRAIAVHTNRAHVFIFAVRTTWARDADGDIGKEVGAEYQLIIAF